MNEATANVPDLVPILPLPEAVLFPRQVLPLHVFEPRYRAMVADALAGAKLIAVALLKPNYEPHYFTSRAPIHRLVGIGRIIAAEKLNEGKFNILLRGEARASMLAELQGRPYRVARIQTIEPRCNASSAIRARLRRALLEAVRQHLATRADACEQYLQWFEAPFSLGELTDLIAGQLPVVGEVRQCLLAELETCTRAKMLLRQVRTLGDVARRPRRADQRT
ncbi:MAG: LON peptidase substrate-binding domain-containing protein, partial [Phycisphaerae bacterium]